MSCQVRSVDPSVGRGHRTITSFTLLRHTHAAAPAATNLAGNVRLLLTRPPLFAQVFLLKLKYSGREEPKRTPLMKRGAREEGKNGAAAAEEEEEKDF